jgi:hypothetical protein
MINVRYHGAPDDDLPSSPRAPSNRETLPSYSRASTHVHSRGSSRSTGMPAYLIIVCILNRSVHYVLCASMFEVVMEFDDNRTPDLEFAGKPGS